MGYRYHAVLIDFGSVRGARTEVSTRSQALQLQVHACLNTLDQTLYRYCESRFGRFKLLESVGLSSAGISILGKVKTGVWSLNSLFVLYKNMIVEILRG